MKGPTDDFRGVKICFTEGETQPEEVIKVLSLNEITDNEEFWYDLQDPSVFLPWGFSITAEGFNITESGLQYQNDDVLTIIFDYTMIGGQKVFRMKKRKEETLPRKIIYNFDGQTPCAIFFKPPQFGDELYVQKTSQNDKSNLNPVMNEQELTLFQPEKIPPIRLRLKDSEEDVTFKVTITKEEDKTSTVTFENAEKGLKLKAKARIVAEGKPVLEYVEQTGQWFDKKVPKQFEIVKFPWKITEDGRLRVKSKAQE